MSHRIALATKTGDDRFIAWITVVDALPSSEFFLDVEQGGIYTTLDRKYSLRREGFSFVVLRDGVAFERAATLREAAKWTHFDRRDIARAEFDAG